MSNGSVEPRQKILREWLTAIAVPLVVAFVGARIQSAIAQQGTGKDYVAIAISVLKDPAVTGSKAEDDRRLVQWASAVLEQNSPVPFPEPAQATAAADADAAGAFASSVAKFIARRAQAGG